MDSKYSCNQCKFYTNYKSKWDLHIITELHKTGKKKTRKDKVCPEKCPKCDYECSVNTTLKQHILSKHSTVDEKKKEFKYYCEKCDFGAFAKQLYDKHCNTTKHKQKK